MNPKLGQWMTPVWFAEAIVERYFPRLDAADLVLEPSCGTGAFLHALPVSVPAVGVELDPLLAARARAETGRQVIDGDFLTVPLSIQPTAVIGNPPFTLRLIERFLERCHQLLPEGGRAGFILPAYTFQTSTTTTRIAERWSIAQELIPRNVFHRLSMPLCFATFSKDRRRTLVGFALYQETCDAQALASEYREALHSGAGIWRRLVAIALRRLGGRAELPQIYAELQGKRPGTNQFWREKIRQTLRHYRADFKPLGDGAYQLRAA